jgi:NADPH:quinone reductase-like Zn-dependent oxidoreductase
VCVCVCVCACVQVSGVVVTAPANSTLRPGDEVMALLPGGGYAEYCVCDERTVVRVPAGVSLLTASALPEAFMTAHQLLFLVARLQPGETVLMHAAASSVGQAALQMAVRRGATVLVTTRSQQKLDVCLALGAHAGIVVGSDHKFADQVLANTGGAGVHVVLDPVGADYLRDNLLALQMDGRLVSYGLLSGGVVPPELNSNTSSASGTSPTLLQQILFKRVSLLGSTLRARTVEYKQALLQALLEDEEAGFPAVAAGHVHVNVSLLLPLSEVQQAHEIMRRNENIGKIVLEVLRRDDGADEL